MFTDQQLQDAFVASFNATKTNLVLGNADTNATAFVEMMGQEFKATANGDTGAFVLRMDANVRKAAPRVKLAGATLVKALNEISATVYALVAAQAVEAAIAQSNVKTIVARINAAIAARADKPAAAVTLVESKVEVTATSTVPSYSMIAFQTARQARINAVKKEAAADVRQQVAVNPMSPADAVASIPAGIVATSRARFVR